jgi:pimeloyl-ACP methyl ester carboxylesterase
MDTQIKHRFVEIAELRLFYREAGPDNAQVLLLLHGFPASSRQYRDLMRLLSGSVRTIAPDFPGFGHSPALDSKRPYTFDMVADCMAELIESLGLQRFFLYMFDYGAPVGFRLAERFSDRIAGVISQNGNAYIEGLGPAMRELDATASAPDARERLHAMLDHQVTRDQYLHGVAEPGLIDPDNWTLDEYWFNQSGRAKAMIDLFLDYHTNVERYPMWQEWLSKHQPPTLVMWGKNDDFFVPAGAQAFTQEVPDAEVHLLDTGHFALETHLHDIAGHVEEFVTTHT